MANIAAWLAMLHGWLAWPSHRCHESKGVLSILSCVGQSQGLTWPRRTARVNVMKVRLRCFHHVYWSRRTQREARDWLHGGRAGGAARIGRMLACGQDKPERVGLTASTTPLLSILSTARIGRGQASIRGHGPGRSCCYLAMVPCCHAAKIRY